MNTTRKISLSILTSLVLATNGLSLTLQQAQGLYDSGVVRLDSAKAQVETAKQNISKYVLLRDSATNSILKKSYDNIVTIYTTLLETLNKNLAVQQKYVDDMTITVAKLTPKPVNESDSIYEPDKVINFTKVDLTSKEYISSSKAYNAVGVKTAWEQGYTGKGITVAVVDTGISANNSDVSKFYGNAIDFTTSYNPTTKLYQKVVLTSGQISDVRTIATGVLSGVVSVNILGNGVGAKADAVLKSDGTLSYVRMIESGQGYSGTVSVEIVDASGNKYTTQAEIAGYDYNGHGTATSSLIGASLNNTGVVGIAFESTVIPIKIGNSILSVYDAIDGAKLAYTRGATIVNQSIEMTKGITVDKVVVDGYKELTKAGVSFVTAAGNSGLDCKTVGNCNSLAVLPWVSGNSDMLTQPGAWIVVGALNSTNTDIATWSNRAGIMKDNFIMAPGSSVITAGLADGSTSSKSGTSFAAPIVSGTMALLQQKWPRLSGAQQWDIMKRTATDMGVSGVDEVYGWGALNVDKAFSPVGNLLVPNAVKNVAGLDKRVASVYSTKVSGGGSIISKIASIEQLKSTTAFDDYQRDYTVDLTSSAVATKESFKFSQTAYVPLKTKGFKVGVNNTYSVPVLGYDVDNNSFSFTKIDGVMGSSGEGSLGYGGSTNYMGWTYKKEGLSAGLTYGYAQVKNTEFSVLSMSDVQSIGFNLEYTLDNGFGVFGGVPNKIISGKVNVSSATSSDVDGSIQYTNNTYDLSKGAFEKVAGISYRKGGFGVTASRSFDVNGNEGVHSDLLSANYSLSF